jgi:hypothetical protein
MYEPQRVLISREGDSLHEQLKAEAGLMIGQPSVGQALQIFFETGKVMTTSPVTRVANDGEETVVDTRNSTYRLKLAA